MENIKAIIFGGGLVFLLSLYVWNRKRKASILSAISKEKTVKKELSLEKKLIASHYTNKSDKKSEPENLTEQTDGRVRDDRGRFIKRGANVNSKNKF